MVGTNSTRTFAAVAYNEVLLNSKRVAPYALMIICSAAAVMGWVKGPAVALGWATKQRLLHFQKSQGFLFPIGAPSLHCNHYGRPGN